MIIVCSRAEVQRIVKQMLGNRLVTKQTTADGVLVNKVLTSCQLFRILIFKHLQWITAYSAANLCEFHFLFKFHVNYLLERAADCQLAHI